MTRFLLLAVAATALLAGWVIPTYGVEEPSRCQLEFDGHLDWTEPRWWCSRDNPNDWDGIRTITRMSLEDWRYYQEHGTHMRRLCVIGGRPDCLMQFRFE